MEFYEFLRICLEQGHKNRARGLPAPCWGLQSRRLPRRLGACQVVDELLGRAAGDAAVAHLPPGGLLEEGFLGQGHPLPLGQGEDDLLELGPVGDGVVDPHPEPGGEGELLLQGVGVVDVVLVLHVRPVLPGLPDEVAAVGGGVEEDVVRLGLHATLDNSF